MGQIPEGNSHHGITSMDWAEEESNQVLDNALSTKICIFSIGTVTHH